MSMTRTASPSRLARVTAESDLSHPRASCLDTLQADGSTTCSSKWVNSNATGTSRRMPWSLRMT